MSIDQLDLILYDMYHMDAWLPPLFGKWAEDYKKASYSQWAVDELRDFIAERIYPRKEGPIDEFCKLTHEFMMKTAIRTSWRRSFIRIYILISDFRLEDNICLNTKKIHYIVPKRRRVTALLIKSGRLSLF